MKKEKEQGEHAFKVFGGFTKNLKKGEEGASKDRISKSHYGAMAVFFG